MQIQILNYTECFDARKVGVVHIRYYNLLLRCEVVFNKRSDKVWIRMPEFWKNGKEKLRFCEWPNNHISRDFQSQILQELFNLYQINKDSIKKKFFRSS